MFNLLNDKFLGFIIKITLTFIIVFAIMFMISILTKANIPALFLDRLTISAAITAAIATCFSAYASNESSKTAYKSLLQTQKITELNNFEQHYNSLLTLHNELHRSVCVFLESEDSMDNENKVVSVGGKKYLSSIRDEPSLEVAHSVLMGHSILSPYMRILYHTLKHVFSYSKDLDVIKKYTSPLRSLIRNDVIYLVAINAAVIYKKDSSEYNGYQDYNKYLRDCDFFEHAVFISNKYKMFSEIKPDIEFAINAHIKNKIHQSVLHYIETFTISEVKFEINKNLLLTMIYENPFSSDIDSILVKLNDYIKIEHEKN